MALRNKKKLTAINKDNHEDNSRNNQARNTKSPRILKDYITQVSKEIEGIETKETASGVQ